MVGAYGLGLLCLLVFCLSLSADTQKPTAAVSLFCLSGHQLVPPAHLSAVLILYSAITVLFLLALLSRLIRLIFPNPLISFTSDFSSASAPFHLNLWYLFCWSGLNSLSQTRLGLTSVMLSCLTTVQHTLTEKNTRWKYNYNKLSLNACVTYSTIKTSKSWFYSPTEPPKEEEERPRTGSSLWLSFRDAFVLYQHWTEWIGLDSTVLHTEKQLRPRVRWGFLWGTLWAVFC